MAAIITSSLSLCENIKICTKHATSCYKPDDASVEGSHVHGEWELYINLSGEVSFFHGKELYPIIRGDIVLSAPGEFHHCIYNSESPHEHICVWVDTAAAPELSEYIGSYRRRGRIRLTPALAPRIISLATELSASAGVARTALFFELLGLSLSGEVALGEDNTALPAELQRIVDYISTNFAELSKIEDIAEEFHISTPTLNRWFRERLDISPKRLLTSKKLAFAEERLRGGASVTEACYLAGFSDLSRFISEFRRTFGKTPLKYKKLKSGTVNDSQLP